MMSPEDSWVAKWQRIGKDLLKHTVMVLKKKKKKKVHSVLRFYVSGHDKKC